MKKFISFLRSDVLDFAMYHCFTWCGVLFPIFGLLAYACGEKTSGAVLISGGAFLLAGSRFYGCKSPSAEGENK